MATAVSKGTIVFGDATKKGRASVRVKAKDVGTPITKAKIDALADLLVLHSKCTLTQETVLDIAREENPVFAGNKDRKGIVTAIEPDGTVHRWGLPDPKDEDCQVLEGTDGEVLIPSVVTTLVQGFATCTGLSLTPLISPVIQD